MLTEDGHKNIEDIKVGDKVLSKNEKTGEQGYKRVSRLFRGKTSRIVNLRIRDLSKSHQSGRSEPHSVGQERSSPEKGEDAGDSDGSDPDGSGSPSDEQEIRCTPEHPFFVRGKSWVEAENLKAGDRLIGDQGEELEVSEVSVSEEKAEHYNFEVEDWHTYFVSDAEQGAGVWVHNLCRGAITKIGRGSLENGVNRLRRASKRVRAGNVVNNPGDFSIALGFEKLYRSGGVLAANPPGRLGKRMVNALDDFANETGSMPWNRWPVDLRMMPSSNFSKGRTILESVNLAASRADRINFFNLSGIRKRGGYLSRELRKPSRTTYAELKMILSSRSLRQKTVFYRNGNRLSPAEAEAFFGRNWNR